MHRIRIVYMSVIVTLKVRDDMRSGQCLQLYSKICRIQNYRDSCNVRTVLDRDSFQLEHKVYLVMNYT